MALEPYDPCPCGDPKKFKFCCQANFHELQAVERLVAEGQPKQALVAAEKLEPQHATNALLLRGKIGALLSLERTQEALEHIEKLLEFHPENPYSDFLQLRWHIYYSDWETARELIEQKFVPLLSRAPEMGRILAIDIVETLAQLPYPLATFRYLSIAFGLSRTEETRKIVSNLYNSLLDSPQILGPMRAMLSLWTLPENQPNQEQFKQAVTLANQGKYRAAAEKFEELHEIDPHQPVFSYNAGLCYAWSCDSAAAAELLGLAADDVPNFETAVQLETLAQLQEASLPEERVEQQSYRYPVVSTGKLLTKLDQSPRLVRQKLNPQQPEGPNLVARYAFANRPASDAPVEDPTQLRYVIGYIEVVDFGSNSEDGINGGLLIRVAHPDMTEAEVEEVLATAGDTVERRDEPGWGNFGPYSSMPRDLAALPLYPVQPAGLPRSAWRRLVLGYQQHVLLDLWTNTPLSILEGVTPAEAAKDPDLHVPVCAAIDALLAFVSLINYHVDASVIREKLGLPKQELIVVNSLQELNDTLRNSLALLDFDKVPQDVLQASLSHLITSRSHYALLRALEATYTRGLKLEGLSQDELCYMAMGQSHATNDLDRAMVWIERGRETTRAGQNDLMTRLRWDMAELDVLIAKGDVEGFIKSLQRVAREYFAKIPECKTAIQSLLDQENLQDSRITAIMSGTDLQAVGAGVGSGSGELWTPESAGSAPAGKLWLPGQE